MLNLQRKEIQTNEKRDQVEFNALTHFLTSMLLRYKVPATTQLKNHSSANDSSRGYFFPLQTALISPNTSGETFILFFLLTPRLPLDDLLHPELNKLS